MAISIDWDTKVITVNQSDCDFVSGTFYTLAVETTFRAEVNALLAAIDGMAFKHAIDHQSEYTVFGDTYARKVEVINGYSVQFLPDSLWSVKLLQANDNLGDVEAFDLVQGHRRRKDALARRLILRTFEVLADVLFSDHVAGREENEALDRVLQLADVPLPGVLLQ